MTLRSFLTTICFVAATLCPGCKREPTSVNPVNDDLTSCSSLPGTRTFSWRSDTIAWWPSTVGGLWAFSDNDAYVLGSIADGTPPYTMRAGRHWNGIQWEDEIHGKWGFDNGTGTWLDIAIDPVGEVIGDDHFMVSVGYWGVGGTIYPGVAEFDNNTKRWTSYHFQTPGELRCVWTDREGYFVSVGDNGMVYTKDGYSASWVYSKAPTDFNLFRLTGVSKDEIYVSGYQGSPTNEFSYQGWKVYRGAWIKLYDTKDTTGTPFHITSADYPSEMGVYRCSVTDSILIYLIGDQSYLFKSFAQMLNFTRTNLSELGLPLKALGRTGLHVDLFSPKDVWIIGTRYNFYHWNGSDFHKLTLPGIPSDDLQFGSQRRLVMTRTGKLFFPTETTSQVYVVDQGIP